MIDELPDDMRCALHSLQADMDYLIARLRSAESEEVGMIRQSIFERLSHVEESAYRMSTAIRQRDEAHTALRTEMERIADLTERWADSLVSQVNQIAREALAAIAAPGGGETRLVPLDVLQGLYNALLVLRIMTKRAGLDAGSAKAVEMIGWLEEIEPALAALSVLRVPAPPAQGGE